MFVHAEGIVIRTRDYGEAHKVVVLFTKEFGKVALMARGVKKPQSRLRGITQVLTHGQYLYFSSSGMGTLNQGETISTYQSVREDIFRMSYAAYIVELLDKLTAEGESNPFLFHLLERTLSYLEQGKDPDILCRIFELKLLSVAGYRPQLEKCVHCGAERTLYVFSVVKGGGLCDNCRTTDRRAIVMSLAVARLLRLFLHLDISRIGSINVKKESKALLERVMGDYIDYYVDVPLKSRAFLQQLKKLEGIN